MPQQGANNMKKLIKKQWFWYLIMLPATVGVLTIIGITKMQKIVDTAYAQGSDGKETIKQEGWEVGYFQGQLDGYSAKEESERNQILKTLAMHESLGGQKRKILDTNNKYSYGLYHFQVDTVIDMYRRYYKINITPERALEIANDDELATKLATDAIFKFNEKYHWLNSFKKMALK
jgi:hypothetical protein